MKTLFVGIAVALLCTTLAFGQKASFVRSDDSDWWSTIREVGKTDLGAPLTHTQHRQFAVPTFEIMRIRIGGGEIARAESLLGHTVIISRGDAATARTQACYIASGSGTYLIFEEQGEGFEHSLYLFDGGANWNGSKFCSKLPAISQPFQTANGLRLGLTQTEVEAVLGKPSTTSPEKLTYVLSVKKRTPPAKLQKLRQQNSHLSDEDFHDSFDFYYVDSFASAKFKSSKLVYLTVTESESYP